MKMSEVGYLWMGAVVGAAVSVLFAPRPGSEVREFLRSKAEDGAEVVTSSASDVREATTEVIQRGKKAVRHRAENITAAVDAGVNTYRDATEATP